MNAIMTRAEREDLQRLVRQREKVLRSAAKQRSAELLADFENQMGSEYSSAPPRFGESTRKSFSSRSIIPRLSSCRTMMRPAPRAPQSLPKPSPVS